MGRYSELIFGRDKLPDSCIIYAGAYLPSRKNIVRRYFDRWERIKGHWIKYTYAWREEKEYLILFNVYGASLMMEVLYLLKDGGVKKTFFIGSAGGKELSIGTIVFPVEVIDKSGPVLIDSGIESVFPRNNIIDRLEGEMRVMGVKYVRGKILSVPCVLHDIKHVRDMFEIREDILGIEMELSTYLYYTNKLGLEGYALIYISDNKRHDIISRSKEVLLARRDALKTATNIALNVL